MRKSRSATYHRGYGVIQGTRPQTIGYSLADTPVGLAAWLLDHDATTYEHLARLFAGQSYGAITPDDVLDNISLYWLTNTATSAARLYWQQAVTGQNFYAAADVHLPAAVTVFPEEYLQAPRSWTEKAYHNLTASAKLNEAATSPPGNSPSCSLPSCARRSAHCAERRALSLPRIVWFAGPKAVPYKSLSAGPLGAAIRDAGITIV